MGLPKQVQRQIEEVNRIEQQIKDAVAPPPTSEVQPTQPPTAAPAQQPETQVVKGAEAPQQPANDDEAKWEHKYKSLANHYTRFAKDQNDKIADLTSKLEALSSKPKEEPKVESSTQPLVTEADVEQFGSDLVGLARRIAKEEFGSREASYKQMIADLKAELKETKQQVGQVSEAQAVTTKETFFSQLESRVPNWESIQASNECQEWLGSRVPGTKNTWNDLLLDAASEKDVERTVELFTTFIESSPKFAAKKQEPKVNSELERQVAPSKSKGSSAALPAEKPVFSMKDVESMSQQIIKLQKTGQYEQAARLENDLNAAFAEGRVRA